MSKPDWQEEIYELAATRQLTLTLTADDLAEWRADLAVRNAIGQPEGCGHSPYMCESIQDAVMEAIKDWRHLQASLVP